MPIPPDEAQSTKDARIAGMYAIAAAVTSALIKNQGDGPSACGDPKPLLAQAVKVQTETIVAALEA